jgi:hypothetical protein
MAFKEELIDLEVNGAKAPSITVRYGDHKSEGKFAFVRYADNPKYLGKDLEFWKQCADTALIMWLGKNALQAKGHCLTEPLFPPNRMVEYM